MYGPGDVWFDDLGHGPDIGGGELTGVEGLDV